MPGHLRYRFCLIHALQADFCIVSHAHLEDTAEPAGQLGGIWLAVAAVPACVDDLLHYPGDLCSRISGQL